MKTRLARLQSLFAFPLAFAAAEATPPNFLVVVADDMRADAIHAHGNSVIQTPVLDRLIADGFSFREAHCMGGTKAIQPPNP